MPRVNLASENVTVMEPMSLQDYQNQVDGCHRHNNSNNDNDRNDDGIDARRYNNDLQVARDFGGQLLELRSSFVFWAPPTRP